MGERVSLWRRDDYGTREWLIALVDTLSYCEHKGDTNDVVDHLVKKYDIPGEWDEDDTTFVVADTSEHGPSDTDRDGSLDS